MDELWLTLHILFLSTLITIYSICQIFTSTKHLSAINNTFAQTIKLSHSFFSVDFELFFRNLLLSAVWVGSKKLRKTNIMLPITNMIIQSFICYICVTIVASKTLNRFDSYLIEEKLGGYELKVVLKEGVPEAIGVPNAVDDVSE